ncbi:enoyl-CoA hydratase-related protein [Agromyces archimandritae]|uniref:enoyl-CoA hydratase n=1 Tax=Agromyces archimandritae TaxID=2781962 RepID=A0A975FLE7_9MICO|nr:enoyl-CoA hydratase-related protein [Agromyces archimandritae]QTX04254.1 enoyl-CoA hydratase/isomerase family protein [Agromyces archimandritae]
MQQDATSETPGPVRVEESDGVAVVTIDRPKALNALSAEVLTALGEAFAALAARGTEVRGVILTGAGGRAFVAGADIRAMADLTAAEAARLARLGHEVAAGIEGLGAPVIAAVDGFALGGGCELALACDLIYATDAAKFGQPEVRLGLIPGFGGTVRLPRAVGPQAARELIYTGRTIDAAEAERLGLVARRFADREALMAGARAVIEEISANAHTAVAIAKQVLTAADGTDTATASGIEVEGFERAFATEDHGEGIAAFLEKRDPSFTGR